MDTDYPPLFEVRNSLRVKWYRCAIDPIKLRALSRRSDLKGGLQAGGHLALFISSGAAVYYFWAQEIWFGLALAVFVHGTIASFFTGVAPHELGHGTVFKTKALNRIFLYLFSFISWWDPFDYSCSHTYHHRYTLYPTGDRENVLPLDPLLNPLLIIQLLTMNVFTQPGRNFGKGGILSAIFVTLKSAFGIVGSTNNPSQEWLQALHIDQPTVARKSMLWSRLLLALHGVVMGGAIISGQWVLILIINFPSFVANWAAYGVGLTQHCGLRDAVPDFRKNSRSITLPFLFEFLYWRMNWHIEHHMFAGVPCYNLKKVAREIAVDMPPPPTVWGAWRDMRDTWNRQKRDPNYQFDTNLPTNPASSHRDAPSILESSIGELAPEQLK